MVENCYSKGLGLVNQVISSNVLFYFWWNSGNPNHQKKAIGELTMIWTG